MAWFVRGVHPVGQFKGSEFLIGYGGMIVSDPKSGRGYDKRDGAVKKMCACRKANNATVKRYHDKNDYEEFCVVEV